MRIQPITLKSLSLIAILIVFAIASAYHEGSIGAQVDGNELIVELVSPNEETDGDFGRTLALIPDTNNDGFDDFMIGAFDEYKGRVYIYDGFSFDLLLMIDSPDADMSGVNVFGRDFIGLPDFDGDSAGDFVARLINQRAALVSGADGTTIEILENTGGAPYSSIPDVSGDGIVELLAGGAGATVNDLIQAGVATIYNLASAARIYTFYSPAPVEFGHFGSSVVGLEDIDGDALGDVAIRGEGKVYLFNGATGELIRTLENPDPTHGGLGAVVAIEDVTGDGVVDLVARELHNVYIFDTVTGDVVLSFDRIYRIGGPSSLAALADVNGDGIADIALGTGGDPPAEHGDGKVRDYHSAKPGFVDVYSGATGEHLFEIRQPGEDYVEFAASLVGLRDTNGDGLAEIVVGAPGENRVYVYLSPFDRFIPVGEEGDGEPEAGGEGQSSEGDGEPEASGEGDPDGRPPILICTPFLENPSDPGDLITLFLMAGFLFRIHRTV